MLSIIPDTQELDEAQCSDDSQECATIPLPSLQEYSESEIKKKPIGLATSDLTMVQRVERKFWFTNPAFNPVSCFQSM